MLTERVTAERPRVTGHGYDPDLGVLWVRLDVVPPSPWIAAFDDLATGTGDERTVVHGRHVLATCSPAERNQRLRAVKRRMHAAGILIASD